MPTMEEKEAKIVYGTTIAHTAEFYKSHITYGHIRFYFLCHYTINLLQKLVSVSKPFYMPFIFIIQTISCIYIAFLWYSFNFISFIFGLLKSKLLATVYGTTIHRRRMMELGPNELFYILQDMLIFFSFFQDKSKPEGKALLQVDLQNEHIKRA